MRVKLVVSALLAFLVVVFVSQNAAVVQVTFLAWSIEMSMLLMIFIVFAVGILIGWLLNSYFRFVRNRKRQLAQAPAVQEVKEAPARDEDINKTEGDKEDV